MKIIAYSEVEPTRYGSPQAKGIAGPLLSARMTMPKTFACGFLKFRVVKTAPFIPMTGNMRFSSIRVRANFTAMVSGTPSRQAMWCSYQAMRTLRSETPVQTS